MADNSTPDAQGFDPDAYLQELRKQDKINTTITKASKAYGVSEAFLRALKDQESAGNPNAVSNKGARGLFQLMPATAQELGVKDINDIEQNIYGGTKYIRQMLDMFDGDVEKALAAYNAGPNAVKKYGGIPPFAETQHYVPAILSKLRPHERNPYIKVDAVRDLLSDINKDTDFDPDAYLQELRAQDTQKTQSQDVGGDPQSQPSIPPESLQDASLSTQRNPYIRQLAEGRLKERNESDYLGRPAPSGQLDENDIQKTMAQMRANRMDRVPIDNPNRKWYSPIEDRQLSDEELRAKVVQDFQNGESNRKDIGDFVSGIFDFKAPWVGEDDPVKNFKARGLGSLETLFPTTSYNPDESLPFSQRRDQNREIEQEISNLRKERSPNAHAAGRMAGDVIAYNSIMKLLGGVGLGPAAAGEAGAVGGAAGTGAKKGVELMKAVLRGGTAGAGVGQLSGSEAKDAPMDAALGAGFEAIAPALGIVLPWAGQRMRNFAPSIVNKMLNVPLKDLEAGKNLGKELVERGIVGTESGLAKRAASRLNENEDLLQGLLEKASIPKKPAIDAASGIVEDIAANPNHLDNKFIVEELRKLQRQFQGQPNRAGEFKRIDRMIEQYGKETPLTFADANEVKRGIYRRNANAYSRDINPVKTEIDTSVARGIRKGTEAKIPETKKINKELSFYGRLSDLVEKKAAKAEKGGGGVNLKELVGSTAAGAVFGPQAGGAAYLGSLLRENPLMATIMAQVANKGGKGLQWLGKGGQLGSFGDALVEAVPPILINRRNQ